jgi:NAD(P)H-quinone oxidoreductase subunit 5
VDLEAAASLCRRHFLASGLLVAVALSLLGVETGATTVSGVLAAVDGSTLVLVAGGVLLLAAMVQSALVPFHGWLLSSMTAPTPASALMHAGFVNAGGVLLVRFAPVLTAEAVLLSAAVLVGTTSALAGKFLKTVRPEAKGALGCSTVGQMGFMIVQVGLGFFGAAIVHLVLHGFYKAYQFLSVGDRVARTAPTTDERGSTGITATGVAVAVGTALAGGFVFTVLTGKGTSLDSGLVLVGLVVLTVLHAAREVAARSVPATFRYGAVPLVALPAIAVYGGLYRVVEGLLAGTPAATAPTPLTALHGLVVVGFLAAYLASETGAYRYSRRLYVALVNAGRPAPGTLLTDTESYDDN